MFIIFVRFHDLVKYDFFFDKHVSSQVYRCLIGYLGSSNLLIMLTAQKGR